MKNILDFIVYVVLFHTKKSLILVGMLFPCKSVRRWAVRRFVLKRVTSCEDAHAFVKAHAIMGVFSSLYLTVGGALVIELACLDIKWITALWDMALNVSVLILIPGGMA